MKCFYDVEIPTNEKIESSQIVKVELDGFSRKITAENELKKSLAETYGSNFKIFERFSRKLFVKSFLEAGLGGSPIAIKPSSTFLSVP